MLLSTLILAFATTSLACVQSPYGTGRCFKAADVHLHAGDWKKMTPALQNFVKTVLPDFLKPIASTVTDLHSTTAAIVLELLAAGVDKGIVLGLYAPETIGEFTNEDAIAKVRSDLTGSLYGFASADFSEPGWSDLRVREERVDGVRRALEERRMVGFKEKNKVVFVHAGTTPFCPIANALCTDAATNPLHIEWAFRAYPTIKFVMLHMGYDFLHRQLGHINTTLSLAQTYPKCIWRFSADQGVGVGGRTVHGGDGNGQIGGVKTRVEMTLGFMKNASYTEDEMQKVLYGTFSDIFSTLIPKRRSVIERRAFETLNQLSR
ncbi:hypothetical protein BC829DRAFT_431784 [Chytridium lagenaria]|nr:hypothetical protein BC829DRAFT_431784 [Chytridium lagenaria]